MKKAALFLLFLQIMNSGCASIEHESWVDPTTLAAAPVAAETDQGKSALGECAKVVNDLAINLDCYYFPEAKGVGHTAYQTVVSKSGTDADLARNRLAWLLISKSDTICTYEMGRLTAHEAMVNFGLDASATVLSTSSSIVTGKLAHNILSGLAGSSTALRTHFDADVYRNAISSTITHAIIADRQKQRDLLATSLKQSSTTYTIDEMISDINRYHQSCSIFYAFQLINDSIDKNASAGDIKPTNSAASAAEKAVVVGAAPVALPSPAVAPVAVPAGDS